MRGLVWAWGPKTYGHAESYGSQLEGIFVCAAFPSTGPVYYLFAGLLSRSRMVLWKAIALWVTAVPLQICKSAYLT